MKRLRERMIAPIVHRIGELEADHTAYLSSHLDDIEANLLGRLAASHSETRTLIERTRQEMRDRSALQLRAFLFEGTCIKELRAETQEGSFFFDVKDDIVGWTIAQGTWEGSETAAIKTLVHPGDFAIDVGANLGWYSVVLGRLVGTAGKVLAFEPEPRNFELLKRNIDENKLSSVCTLVQTALLDKKGTCTFEKSHNNFGDHRVRFASPQTFKDNFFCEVEREETTVPTDTLDAALRAADLSDRPIRLLKLDTQGCETLIFRGAEAALARTEFLLSEYWPYGMRRLGVSPDDFISIVSRYFSEFSTCESGQLHFKSIDHLRSTTQSLPDVDFSGTTFIFRK